MMKHSPFDKNKQTNLLFVQNYKIMTKKTDVPYIDETIYQGYKSHDRSLHNHENQFQQKGFFNNRSVISSNYYSKNLNHSFSAQKLLRRNALLDYQAIKQQKYVKQTSLLKKYGPQALRYTAISKPQVSSYYNQSVLPSQYYSNQPKIAKNTRNVKAYTNRVQAPQIHDYPYKNDNYNNEKNNENYSQIKNYHPKRQEIIFHGQSMRQQQQYEYYGVYHNPESLIKQQQKNQDSPNFCSNTNQQYDIHSKYNREVITYRDKKNYYTVTGNNKFDNNPQFNKKFLEDAIDSLNSSSSDLRDSDWKSAILQAENTKNPFVYQSGVQQQQFGTSYNEFNKNTQTNTANKIPQYIQWQSKTFHRIT